MQVMMFLVHGGIAIIDLGPTPFPHTDPPGWVTQGAHSLAT